MSVKHKVKSSITSSTTTTTTEGVNLKVELGKEVAQYALSVGGVLGFKFTNTQATQNMKQIAQEKTSEASVEVGPGEKWVVSQMVGQAGWTTVNTLKFKSEKTRCAPELTTSTTANTAEKSASEKSDKKSYLDCTHKFKDSIASFENNYYQGYWLYPSQTTYHWYTNKLPL